MHFDLVHRINLVNSSEFNSLDRFFQFQEAKTYIDNLIKKYGTFNYAEPITVLNGNFLERHLYDMIPNAWKELGRSDIPPPIPKKNPDAYRNYFPVKQEKEETLDPSQEASTSAGNLTRRMSAVDYSHSESATEKKASSIELSSRELRVQLERLPSSTTDLPSFIQATTTHKGEYSLMLKSFIYMRRYFRYRCKKFQDQF